MTTAFFIVSIVSAVFVLNAFFPRRDPVLLLPSFMSAWLTIELAPWWLVWQAVIVAVFAAEGAIEGTKGVIGLALAVGERRRTGRDIPAARGERSSPCGTRWGPRHERRTAFPGSLVFFPILMRHRRGVVTVRNIVFATYGKKKIKTRRRQGGRARPGDRRPGVLQIHGGGWVIGDKREQGSRCCNTLPPTDGWASTPTIA